MRYDLRATLGGMIVSALILAVIVTLEPTARLMQFQVPTAAAPVSRPEKYQLMDAGRATASLLNWRKPPARPRLPSESREIK